MEEKNLSFKTFLISPLGKAVLIAALYLIIMLILAPIMSLFEDAPGVIVIFAAAFIYFGWQALNVIQPSMFLIMPIGSWITYFIIKGILALIIGVFVTPFIIARKITNAIQENIS